MGPGPGRLSVLSVAFLAGAQGLLAQALLLREELVLYGGNEVAVGAFLGLWLAGIAAGALGLRRGGRNAAVVALLAQPLLLLLCVVAARTARSLSGVPAYEPFPLTGLLLWSLPIAFPVPVATGATFPALAGLGSRAGVSVTAVYVCESLGSLAGGVGGTLLLAAGLPTGSILVGSLAAGAGAACLACGPRLRVVLAGAALVAAACVPVLGPTVGAALRSRQVEAVLPGSRCLDAVDTATGTLALASLGEQEVLLSDGAVLAAFPDPQRVARAAGALAALSGGPRRLLVAGGEAVDLLPGLLDLSALERVVWVVADPGFAEFARRHVPDLADRRLRVVVGDPARLDPESLGEGLFDAVWVLVGAPVRRADDRFLSLEGLRGFARLLSDEGILLVPVRSAENYVGPRLRASVGVVAAGVAAALPAVRLVPGEDGFLLGSRSEERVRRDPAELERIYRSLGPAPVRLTEEDFRSLLDPRRVEDADRLLAGLLADARVRPSTAERPAALFHNLLVRAERESPDLADILEVFRARRGLLAVPLGVLLLFGVAGVARRAGGPGGGEAVAAATLAAAGAAGMALDLVLLHIYQGRFGTLYLEAGWLFGLWMGGFAAGGIGMRRLCAEGRERGLGASVFLLVAVVAAGVAGLGAAAVPGRAVGGLAFLVAGSLTGALVPVAEAVLAGSGVTGAFAGSTVGAAEHVGASLAALLFGVAVIPVAGIRGAAAVATALALFGAGVLWFSRVAKHRRRGKPESREPARVGHVLPLVLLAVGCAAVAGNWAARFAGGGPQVRLSAETLAAGGLPAPWNEVPEPVVHYRSRAPEAAGVAVATRSVGRFSGYGGTLNLLVVAGPDGVLRKVSLLEHRETPAYVEGIGEFLESFRGSSLLAPFVLRVGRDGARGGQPVDALTGATVTSRAVVEALEVTGRRLSEPVFGRPYRELSAGRGGGVHANALYLLAAAIFTPPVLLGGGRLLRRGWLLLHLAVGGVLLGVQFSSVQVLSLLRLELALTAWPGFLAVGVLFSSALWGPVYCGYICPAGALQEVLAWVGGVLGVTRRPSEALVRGLTLARQAVLAAVVVGALGFGLSRIEDLDLLRFLWASRKPLPVVVLLALVGFGSLLSPRFGCRGFCPAGAFLGIANRFAPLRSRLPEKRYAACDLGVRGEADAGCVQCYRCRREVPSPPAAPVHSRVVQLVLAAAVALLLWGGLPSLGPGGAASGLARIETFDEGSLRRKMEAGSLSEHPALYWRPAGP